MKNTFLSVLTSPFWGPRKIEELNEITKRTQETSDKLSSETEENLKKVDSLYLEVQSFRKKMEEDSQKSAAQFEQSNATLQSLIETARKINDGLTQDRTTVSELQEKCNISLARSKEILAAGESHVNASKDLLEKSAILRLEIEKSKEELARRGTELSRQISEKNDVLTTLSEKSDRALAEVEETCTQTRQMLDAVRDIQENTEHAIADVRQQTAESTNMVKAMLGTANVMLDGLRSDRASLEDLRKSSQVVLSTAEKILAESEENKQQAELILQEAANKKGEAILVGEQQKKRAAMALNLCATSISNIIACGNIEAMEQEYNSILNNINLQMIVKDEPLLATMRKILDTITFFRLQEGDRKRLEERHHQRMNNLLWSSLSSAGGLFVVGGNPWAIAAFAVIQAGSMYVGYQNKKKDAQMQLDDELWKLERSAIEQLHALRASLFETAWHLSDIYNFKDEWRLTVRQIEWYNEIRAEPDHVLRYKKLEQYRDDFEAYPYYWYELGVAAQSVYEEIKEKGEASALWLSNAEKHFAKFLDLDQSMGLLRQDVIGADARLRHISLLAIQKNWIEAVRIDSTFLGTVKRLAVDDPELLLKSALVYASAYQEFCRKKHCSAAEEKEKTQYAKQAIVFFEMLVMKGNNLPMSSILLSELYLQTGMKDKYIELRDLAEHQLNAQILLVPVDGTANERQKMVNEAWTNMFHSRCIPLAELFAKDYDTVLKTTHPDIYNTDSSQQHERMFAWIQKVFAQGQSGIKQAFFDFWEPIKQQLNETFVFSEKSLGLNHDALCKLAHEINDQTYIKIAQISDERVLIKTEHNKADRCMSLLVAIEDWQNGIREKYIQSMLMIVGNAELKNEKDLIPDDINALLSFHLDSIIYRRQLVGYDRSGFSAPDAYNFFADNLNPETAASDSELPDGCEIDWTECNGAKIDFLIKNRYSYTINCATITKDKYDLLEKILRAKYPSRDTSWRDKRTWYGVDWFRKAKAKTFGAQDYEITFFEKKIYVEYTRQKGDEGTRAVKLLSHRAVEREFLRLKGSCVTENDMARFREITARWLSDKFMEIRSAEDEKQAMKLRKALIKEIKERCKDQNTKDILERIIRISMENSSIETERQKLLPLLDAR